MAKRKASGVKPTRLFKKAKPEVATKSYVRKQIAATKERHYKAFALNEESLSTVTQGSFVDPLDIGQGDTINDRAGDTIYVTGIRIRGVLHNNASNINMVRMCLLQTNEDANFSAATDLFESGTGAVDFSTVTGLNTMYHDFEKQKIKVKWDQVVSLGTASDTSSAQVKYFDQFIRFPGRGLKVKYLGSSTGAAQVFPRLHLGFWAAEAPDDTSTGTTVEVSMRALTYFTN